ncbi:hypothetical protein [Aquibacillus saliphilus]|uniref:hypothetical protein n=1 Tax=Aquibacillus saliphilus TaxID=1909422 RepID=UPI001CF0AE8F|nr:hypothetical protein [Aquibacillus saliphilus]
MTKVFLTESVTTVGNRYKGNEIYDLEGTELQSTLDTGYAYKFDVPEINQYSKNVSSAVSKFKKEVKKLDESTDPRYKDVDFKNEAIEKLKAELKTEVDRTQADYKEMLDSIREEAAQEVANADVHISENDSRQASIRAKQLASEVLLGQGADALDQLAEDMKHMSAGRRQALSLELPQVMQAVKGDEKLESRVKSIYTQSKGGYTEEVIFAKGVKALPDSCTLAYDQTTMINPHFTKENRSNIHGK